MPFEVIDFARFSLVYSQDTIESVGELIVDETLSLFDSLVLYVLFFVLDKIHLFYFFWRVV